MGVEKTAMHRPRVYYIENNKNSLLYTDFLPTTRNVFWSRFMVLRLHFIVIIILLALGVRILA